MKDIKELIKKCINSETAKILHDKLKSIWDNDEFIFGTLSDLKNDESKQKMIDILETGLTDTDEIILSSLAIRENTTVRELKDRYEIDW